MSASYLVLPLTEMWRQAGEVTARVRDVCRN